MGSTLVIVCSWLDVQVRTHPSIGGLLGFYNAAKINSLNPTTNILLTLYFKYIMFYWGTCNFSSVQVQVDIYFIFHYNA